MKQLKLILVSVAIGVVAALAIAGGVIVYQIFAETVELWLPVLCVFAFVMVVTTPLAAFTERNIRFKYPEIPIATPVPNLEEEKGEL